MGGEWEEKEFFDGVDLWSHLDIILQLGLEGGVRVHSQNAFSSPHFLPFLQQCLTMRVYFCCLINTLIVQTKMWGGERFSLNGHLHP